MATVYNIFKQRKISEYPSENARRLLMQSPDIMVAKNPKLHAYLMSAKSGSFSLFGMSHTHYYIMIQLWSHEPNQPTQQRLAWFMMVCLAAVLLACRLPQTVINYARIKCYEKGAEGKWESERCSYTGNVQSLAKSGGCKVTERELPLRTRFIVVRNGFEQGKVSWPKIDRGEIVSPSNNANKWNTSMWWWHW